MATERVTHDERFDRDPQLLSYETWMKLINVLCVRHYACSIHDLPDMCFRDAYDDGASAVEFFNSTVADEITCSGFGDITVEVVYKPKEVA